MINRKTLGFIILGVVGLLVMWYLRSDKEGSDSKRSADVNLLPLNVSDRLRAKLQR